MSKMDTQQTHFPTAPKADDLNKFILMYVVTHAELYLHTHNISTLYFVQVFSVNLLCIRPQ